MSKNISHLICVTASTARAPRKISAVSSNATSSCRLCKSVGDSAHKKNLFGKVNHVLLVAVEEIYSSSLQMSELLPKMSKATDNSVACISRGTRRGLDFELCEPNSKLKSGCNVWQILW